MYERLVAQNQGTLVFIQYMKFARRSEGIKGGRAIFKRGRSSPHCSYHLFVVSGLVFSSCYTIALMEWQLNKDTQVARNVFELGMNKFGAEAEYVLEYINFLSHLNEENNILMIIVFTLKDLRVLFEKAVNTIPKEKAREIWNLYVQFEYSYGDLSSIVKIESRKIKTYPETDTSAMLPLVNRFRYMDLWPCNNAELDSFGMLSINSYSLQKNYLNQNLNMVKVMVKRKMTFIMVKRMQNCLDFLVLTCPCWFHSKMKL